MTAIGRPVAERRALTSSQLEASALPPPSWRMSCAPIELSVTLEALAPGSGGPTGGN